MSVIEWIGIAAAGLGWIWSKIRDRKSVTTSTVWKLAREAFRAIEGVARGLPGSEKESRALAELRRLAAAHGVRLTDSHIALAREAFRAFADGEKVEAARFAEALKRLTAGLPGPLAPSFAPPAGSKP
jgi:hypothetical protein